MFLFTTLSFSINIYIWRQNLTIWINSSSALIHLRTLWFKYISADELKEFINIPCKIKAGVFILCMEEQIRSTINMLRVTHETQCCNAINSRIQIHEISPDILIYFTWRSLSILCVTQFYQEHDGLSTDDLQVSDYKNIPKQGQPDHELLESFSINMPYIPIS